MFEEPFYLTKTEAKYCLLIAGIAAEAGRGTDIGTKAEALIRQLEAEMEKYATSYTKLEELSKQKEAVDSMLDEKIERFLELQELVDSLITSH